ncbi:MAG: hypothetical protein IJO48_03990 [Clostridia bacterium]|nr:hypothetical protein [Clostridia bacterium]
MHPSGEWGVEWGYSNPIKKFTVSGDSLSYEEITLAEADGLMRLCVDEKGNIFACDACVLEDGSILALMTDERQDASADEVIAFRLSGF